MRGLGQFLLIGCLLTIPAAAQRGGGGRGGGGGFHGGMAGGFHGGMAGGFHGGGFAGSGFRGGFGGFHGGGFNGFHNGFRGGFRHFGFFPRNRFYFGFGYYPWVYSGGWGYPYYGYPNYDYYYPSYSYPSSYTSYAPSATSPVVIYQSPPAVVHEDTQQPETPAPLQTSSPQGGEKPIYLIALKGQDNVCTAQAYWVTQTTLHFITLEGEARQAPISSVNRALTLRLNRDRQVDFRLPADK